MPYIVESNLKVREVTVDKNTGEFSIIHFNDSDIQCRLMLRTSRIFQTKEEAEAHLPYGKPASITGTPWDYLH